jgi:hypothetical protein
MFCNAMRESSIVRASFKIVSARRNGFVPHGRRAHPAKTCSKIFEGCCVPNGPFAEARLTHWINVTIAITPKDPTTVRATKQRSIKLI